MTVPAHDTPNTLKQAALELEQDQQRLDHLRRQSDQFRLEADNLERQAQDLRKKLVAEARKSDSQLKDIAQDEKDAKEKPAFVDAKQKYEQARQDSGLSELAVAKKERRQEIDEAVDAEPELQELRQMAESRKTQAEDAESELQQLEGQVVQESRQLITRVANMQLSLF